MNLIVLEKPSIIKSRPFPHHQKCQATIVRSKMIQSRDAQKSKKFHLHRTKSILFLILQVCSGFYLATNMNGTLRGLFYHLFSVIYISLFFAVRFVKTFERLAKTFQFLKIFMAVIQEHYFRHRHQGCALRKISRSPSGSQAFQLRCPDLKVGRPNKNFGEPFGLPSIPAGVPRPLKLVARVMRKFCTHMNLTGLLITKLGNFSFWVPQKPASCLMKPIKVFVPFRFKTRNVSNTVELFRF